MISKIRTERQWFWENEYSRFLLEGIKGRTICKEKETKTHGTWFWNTRSAFVERILCQTGRGVRALKIKPTNNGTILIFPMLPKKRISKTFVFHDKHALFACLYEGTHKTKKDKSNTNLTIWKVRKHEYA